MKTQKKISKKVNLELNDDPLAGDMSSFIKEGIDEGSWESVRFELSGKKDRVFSLRLSEKLLSELKKQAKAVGLDTQKFVRIILESTIRKRAR